MKKGFTLIELLVVVLIIGILSAVALPQYKKAVTKSRASNMTSLAKAVCTAEEEYFMANGTYTNDWDLLSVEFASRVRDSGMLYLADGHTKMLLSLEGRESPYAVSVWDDRVPGLNLYFAYSNNRSLWANRKYCYASKTNNTAQELCKFLTQNEQRGDCGNSGWCYSFK